ncbi:MULTISPECIES: DUF2188 domain-containing protein [unclassified Paenibacillus]|uniref:DUF2188 domain-containing protein n=1 Tax=unclassified Paenibacillus TaxID=185978 RepID=UPI002406BCA2|nr:MULTISPECIES: DUF2188 domain-containing protein [unclassified Paenibacillus]MDF9839301.1 hypothetical protein [Paenibacillus sp. PastF-2]MDF9845882.1 hypothetical protein [Paenibacillus sp. PastM-2]MDF9852455.1 hypothetical protein [Paenibacillus sp. PastF-1]MDH6477815.1 hypothetical protein [Paenibacillus sp. PastH-2]MDH6505554.1 hypothetical protein [Paenibacillus sp. PastM-3]
MADQRKHNIHTTPNPNGGWDIQSAGGGKLSHHRTKEEAEQAGREEAKKARTELKIHNKDGKISDSVSYGNDPYPPKG